MRGAEERGWRGLLGLAGRAGKLAAGTHAATEALRRDRASLVLLAEDAAPRSVENFRRWCREGAVPLWVLTGQAGQDSLGRWIGRPPTAVVAILDHHLAAGILNYLSGSGTASRAGRPDNGGDEHG